MSSQFEQLVRIEMMEHHANTIDAELGDEMKRGCKYGLPVIGSLAVGVLANRYAPSPVIEAPILAISALGYVYGTVKFASHAVREILPRMAEIRDTVDIANRTAKNHGFIRDFKVGRKLVTIGI